MIAINSFFGSTESKQWGTVEVEVPLHVGQVRRGVMKKILLDFKNDLDVTIAPIAFGGTRGCELCESVNRIGVEPGEYGSFEIYITVPKDWPDSQYQGHFIIRTNSRKLIRINVTAQLDAVLIHDEKLNL
jgi:hypothetical protein